MSGYLLATASSETTTCIMILKRSHLTFGLMVMRAGKACQTCPLLLIGQNNYRPVVCEAERRVVWRDGDTVPAASTSLNYRGDR